MAGHAPQKFYLAAEEIKELAGLCPRLNGAARTNIVLVIGYKIKLLRDMEVPANHLEVLKCLVRLRYALMENDLDILEVEALILGLTEGMLAEGLPTEV